MEIRHLIRLTGILLHQESTVGTERSQLNVMSGGYCGGVPPLPIPNREVKPACADGTAMQCGRVGGRLLSHTGESRRQVSGALLFSFWSFYLYGLIQTNKGCYFCLMVLQSDFIYSFLGIAGADTLDIGGDKF